MCPSGRLSRWFAFYWICSTCETFYSFILIIASALIWDFYHRAIWSIAATGMNRSYTYVYLSTNCIQRNIQHHSPRLLQSQLKCKMQFEKVLNKFVKFFYFCGLNFYPSFDGVFAMKTKRNRFVHYIPIATLLLLIVISSIASFLCQYLKDPGRISLTYIYPVTVTVTMFLCVFQMLSHRSNFATISSHIRAIDSLSWGKFSSVSSDFNCHFQRRTCIIFFVFLVKLVLSLMRRQATWRIVTITLALNILRALIYVALLHASFYIDFLGHMLQCFVSHIDSRTTTAASVIQFRRSSGHQLAAEILLFKIIHFYLWRISQSINQLFGWTVSIIILQFFVLAIYDVQNTYSLLLQKQAEPALLLREYLK